MVSAMAPSMAGAAGGFLRAGKTRRRNAAAATATAISRSSRAAPSATAAPPAKTGSTAKIGRARERQQHGAQGELAKGSDGIGAAHERQARRPGDRRGGQHQHHAGRGGPLEQPRAPSARAATSGSATCRMSTARRAGPSAARGGTEASGPSRSAARNSSTPIIGTMATENARARPGAAMPDDQTGDQHPAPVACRASARARLTAPPPRAPPGRSCPTAPASAPPAATSRPGRSPAPTHRRTRSASRTSA